MAACIRVACVCTGRGNIGRGRLCDHVTPENYRLHLRFPEATAIGRVRSGAQRHADYFDDPDSLLLCFSPNYRTRLLWSCYWKEEPMFTAEPSRARPPYPSHNVTSPNA